MEKVAINLTFFRFMSLKLNKLSRTMKTVENSYAKSTILNRFLKYLMREYLSPLNWSHSI